MRRRDGILDGRVRGGGGIVGGRVRGGDGLKGVVGEGARSKGSCYCVNRR